VTHACVKTLKRAHFRAWSADILCMQFTNAPLVAPDLSPLPANEAQRLPALWTSQLLDTPPEPDCDALVRLAAQTLRMPMAWMALADADRLWFKARMGFDMAEMPRAIAPCAHTLLRPEQPLLVSDLTQDNRFAAQPCVLGAPHWRSYAGVALVNAQGHALGTLAVASPLPCAFSLQDAANLHDLGLLAQDALDKRRLTQQLIHMTLSDPLTGLSNRNAFHQALQVELAHAMRCGEPFSVLCMDLDGFKAVNEGFGHAAGEEVLCEVARRLREQVRLGDLLARFGSDEFGVVMRHGAQESAQALAKRIVQAVCAPITLSSGDTIGVGISVGIASYTDDIDSTGTLLKHADQALFQAKQQNEKRWKMFVGIR
jgi:diguanylate cyclase (GGDEF)-like protein